MRTQITLNSEGIQLDTEENAASFSSQFSYHEMAPIPVREVNIVDQLQANLETLRDLQSRLNFMMREIRYLMKV